MLSKLGMSRKAPRKMTSKDEEELGDRRKKERWKGMRKEGNQMSSFKIKSTFLKSGCPKRLLHN